MKLHQVLPHCDTNLAELSRRLYGRQIAWDDESGSTLRWQSVLSDTAALQLRIEMDGELLEVQWLEDLPAHWPEELSHPAVPETLRRTVLELVVERVLQRLIHRLGRPVRYTLLEAQAQVPAWGVNDALCWMLISPAAPHPLCGMIRAVTASGWAQLAAVLPVQPTAYKNQDGQRLRLRVHCAPIALTKEQLADVCIGDVLVLDAGLGTAERLAARLELSGRPVPGLRALYLGQALLITQTQARDDSAWENSSPRILSMTTPIETKLDPLPIWVDVELASFSLSLGQLRSLDIGQIFELDAPHTPSRVVLSCDGQRLGVAELVVVGERLGVRVVELASATTTDAAQSIADVAA